MRVLRARIDRFGPLEDVDTGEEDLPGLVAVLGPNEAGKTSFFLALRALLHGIYPASREGNPHSPWGGDDLEIRGELRSDAGERLSVHRRLLSTPWGRLSRGHASGAGDGSRSARGVEVEDLGNRSVPGIDDLPRNLYEHVYTVTLPELARLQEGDPWNELRDRLVVGMGTRDLGSPRRVAKALEDEANTLWRPDRRSNPRDRQIRDALAALDDRLRAARDRDRELRDLVRTQAEGAARLESVRSREERLRRSLGAARTFRPLGARLQTVRTLREAAGPRGLLDALPPDPSARLGELREEVETSGTALEAAERAEAEAGQAHPGPEPLLDALEAERERVRSLVTRRPLAEDRKARIARLETELARLDAGLRSATAPLLEEGKGATWLAAAGTCDVLAGIPLGELRRRIRLREEAVARRQTIQEQQGGGVGAEATEAAETPRPRGALATLLGGGALLLLALLLAFLGGSGSGPASDDPTLPLLLGGAGLVAILVGWVGLRDWDRQRGEARREVDRRARIRAEAKSRVDALRSEEEEHRRNTLELLAALPLREDRRACPDASLVSELESLRGLVEHQATLRREVVTVRGEQEALEGEIRDLVSDLPEEARGALQIPDEPGLALALLASASSRVEARAERRARGEAALATTTRDRAQARSRYDAATAALRGFLERLEHAVPGDADPEARAREVERRKEALHEADAIERELIRAHGSLAAVDAGLQALAEDPLLDGRSIESIEEELDALAREVGDLRESLAGHAHREETLLSQETVDRVEAAREGLREEQREVREERDRLWFLAQLVRTAEREFRDTHQPALIRRAERHLARITGGRYDRLLLGDGDDPDALFLRAPHLPGPVDVGEPISTGTREQVFLSLRLAILPLLEDDGETLPLVLDEALVNWDPARRARALDLLEAVAAERQIFLFTCHAHIAREVAARGGRLLTLPDPPVPGESG